MSNGPLPSQLCLLSELPSKAVHSKVRFLSCVSSYSTSSGILALEHHQPMDTHRVFALVNVDLILESLKAEQTRPGQWVNLIGYITSISPLADESSGHRVTNVHVQALLLWSAGPLDLERYEKSVKNLEAGRISAAARSTSLSDTLLQP
ncbi:CST complex subunit Ten1 [Rhypophila decipiens]|uniref:CST complex subunit Ten1 n=1 Tax=Rhypophila decipiens TaxID=261697 RepID=A0AAN6YFK2_9PEZI|nr:CST complex subunit Ten1 [Rhypophila decipiens]